MIRYLRWLTASCCIGVLVGCYLFRPSYHYHFVFPINATPSQDTLVLGDTLWYDMEVSNTLYDHNTEEWQDLSDFELRFEFYIQHLDSAYLQGGPVPEDRVTFVTEAGNLAPERLTYGITMINMVSIAQKSFRFGVIPQDTGLYYSQFEFDPEYSRAEHRHSEAGLRVTGLHRAETITQSTILVNGRANHPHLVEGVCHYYNNGKLSGCYDSLEYRRLNSYAFYVKIP